MKKTLLFILFSVVYMSAAQAALKKATRGSNCQSLLSSQYFGSLSKSYKAVVETLLDAQQKKSTVVITKSAWHREKFQGRVSDLRFEDSRFRFRLNGKDHEIFDIVEIRQIDEIVDTSAIINQIPAKHRETVRSLVEAQAKGLKVALPQSGSFGAGNFEESKGVVSNMRLEDGKLMFDLDGRPYKTNDSNFKVRVVSLVTDESEILRFVPSTERQIVKTLLNARNKNLKIAVKDSFNREESKGKVTNIRIEDGEFLFDFKNDSLGIATYDLKGLSVRIIKVRPIK